MKKRLFAYVIAWTLLAGLTLPAFAAQTPSVVWIDEGLDVISGYTFSEGLLPVCTGLDNPYWKCGFIDTTGKVVISPQFDDVGDFSEGLVRIQDRSDDFLWGYADKTGKVVIPYQYVFAGDFSDGLAPVAKNVEIEPDGLYSLRWGYIDKSGREVIPLQYQNTKGFSEGLAAVQKDGRWGYIDKSGKEVIPTTYYDAKDFQDGIAPVMFVMKPDFTWAYIDRNNEFAITPHLLCTDALSFFYDANLALIRKGNNGVFKNGYVDKLGMISIPPIYDNAEVFREGYAPVEKNGKWGYIDEKGKVVIPLEYSQAGQFINGLAAVKKGGKAGYINTAGEIIIPFEYDNAYNFSDGIALVKKGGRLGILSLTSIPPTPSVSTVGGFTDVKSNDYYADAVLWAVEQKITSGTSKTTFSPNNTCSNAEILTFLWRANGSPEPIAANPFTDIKTTDYFYKAALWAAEKGLVSGSTFGANTDCTRAMTMEYMWKAAGSPAASYNGKFNDVPASADYAQAVAWAVENNITSGTGGSNFSPAATCTRGQIVTFLHRAMGK